MNDNIEVLCVKVPKLVAIAQGDFNGMIDAYTDMLNRIPGATPQRMGTESPLDFRRSRVPLTVYSNAGGEEDNSKTLVRTTRLGFGEHLEKIQYLCEIAARDVFAANITYLEKVQSALITVAEGFAAEDEAVGEAIDNSGYDLELD